MKSNITHTFTFIRAKPKTQRSGETAIERACEDLPQFRDPDNITLFLYLSSDIALWLRMLVRSLPNHRPIGGKELVERYPVPCEVPLPPAPDDSAFAQRLTANRLRRLFFHDLDFFELDLDCVTVRREGLTLVCHYEG